MRQEDDELLLAYLLDGLSPDERAALDNRLEHDPSLATRLEALRSCLDDPEGAGQAAPQGLADRTTESIHGVCSASAPRVIGLSACDMGAIAFAVLLLIAMLGPALLSNREASRRILCEANFKSLGDALRRYALDHGNRFPAVQPGHHAGAYVLALAEGEYLHRDTLRRSVVCPSSSMAQQLAASTLSVRVPTRDEMRVAHAVLRDRLRTIMGGTTAFSLGYLDDSGHYVATLRGHDARRPLLAEAPTRSGNGHECFNHGASGQNVLFRDGSLRFVSGAYLPSQCDTTLDHLFINHQGQLAAGVDWRDAVLAPSWATPGVLPNKTAPVGFHP